MSSPCFFLVTGASKMSAGLQVDLIEVIRHCRPGWWWAWMAWGRHLSWTHLQQFIDYVRVRKQPHPFPFHDISCRHPPRRRESPSVSSSKMISLHGTSSRVTSRKSTATRQRVSRACDRCNQLRTKCDGQSPCEHCVGTYLRESLFFFFSSFPIIIISPIS